MSNALTGMFLGALIGGSLGLGLCVFVIDGTLWFPGDTIVAGALICGTLGFVLGEDFIDWLKENWSSFWY